MKEHMKKIICSLCLSLAMVNMTAAAVKQPVCLNVCLPEIEGIPQESAKVLNNKLLQIAATNTLSSMGKSSRFFLSANVAIISKDIVPSNPPIISQRLSVILYIGDVIEDVVYATESVELIGAGTNEAKAYNTAFQKLQVKNLDSFLNNAFEKIEAYYEKNYEKKINEAKILEGQKDYNGALLILSELMAVSDSHLDECTSLWNKIYKEQIDYEGERALYMAKNAWAASKDDKGAEDAINLLCSVSPESSSIKYADALVKEIETHIASSKQATANELKKKYNDEIELKRAEIKSRTVSEQAIVYHEEKGLIDLKKVTRIVSSWFN